MKYVISPNDRVIVEQDIDSSKDIGLTIANLTRAHVWLSLDDAVELVEALTMCLRKAGVGK